MPLNAVTPARDATTPIESTWLGPRLAILPCDPIAAEPPTADRTVLPLQPPVAPSRCRKKALPMHPGQLVDVSQYLPTPADSGTRLPAPDRDARLDELARQLGSCDDEIDGPGEMSDEAHHVLPLMRRRWSARRRLDAGHPYGRTARLEANLERLLDELEAEVARLSDCLDTILVGTPQE